MIDLQNRQKIGRQNQSAVKNRELVLLRLKIF